MIHMYYMLDSCCILIKIKNTGIFSVQDVVLELLRENITAKASSSKGFLIDGYPREMGQGIKFEEQVRVQYMYMYIA